MKGALMISAFCMAFACFGKPADYHFVGESLRIDQNDINLHYTNHYLVVHYDAVDGVDVNDVKPHRSFGSMCKLVKVEEVRTMLDGIDGFENVDWAFYYGYNPPSSKKRSQAAMRAGSDGVSFSPRYWKMIEPNEDAAAHGNIVYEKKEDADRQVRKRKRVGMPLSFSFIGNGPAEWVEKDSVSVARSESNEEEDDEEPKPVYETLPNGRKVQVIGGVRRYVVNDDLTPVKPQIEVLPNGVAVRVSSSGRRIRVDIDTLEDIDREPPKRETVRKLPDQKKQSEHPKRIFRPGRSKLKE